MREILGASAMDHLRARAFEVPWVGTCAFACHVLGQFIPFLTLASSLLSFSTSLSFSPMHPVSSALLVALTTVAGSWHLSFC